MKIYSLTKEKYEQLKRKLEEMQSKLEEYKNLSVEEVWIEDLDTLKNTLTKNET